MKRLIELAKKIQNKELREKTIDMLKNFEITNKRFKKYKKIPLEKAFGGPTQFHHDYEGGLLDHTYSVTKLCLQIANVFEEVYGIEVNRDYLIAGALLHDIMKMYWYRKEGNIVVPTDAMIDHGIWACCELYLRDFPEEVIHIIASHFGPQGPNPPQTIEAIILFYADSLDANVDMSVRKKNLETFLL